MNGAKSTFKRKGYWLTAFAAAVLLAASPGTASAQVTVTGRMWPRASRHDYRDRQGDLSRPLPAVMAYRDLDA